jgi:putative membrane protein
MRMAFLTQHEQASIADAIRTAEARTNGEIVTVVTAESESYVWPAMFAATLIAFIVPGIIAPFVGLVSSGDLFFIQLVALLVLQIPLLVPRIRFALVPASIKRDRARRRAREQFVERDLHLTQARTGVLIFVSIAERYVEILADDGINAKVGQAQWQAIVDTFVADVRAGTVANGFCTAIEKVGDILAQHFPADDKNSDELPNRLFVI